MKRYFQHRQKAAFTAIAASISLSVTLRHEQVQHSEHLQGNSSPIYCSAEAQRRFRDSAATLRASLVVERVLWLDEERRREDDVSPVLNTVEFVADRDLRSLTMEGPITCSSRLNIKVLVLGIHRVLRPSMLYLITYAIQFGFRS